MMNTVLHKNRANNRLVAFVAVMAVLCCSWQAWPQSVTVKNSEKVKTKNSQDEKAASDQQQISLPVTDDSKQANPVAPTTTLNTQNSVSSSKATNSNNTINSNNANVQGVQPIAPQLKTPKTADPVNPTNSFIAATKKETDTPPLLTAIQPSQCLAPGATFTLTGRFLDHHKKHRAVLDGQTGHFHLDILSFSTTALSIRIPVDIDTSYPGPMALYLESPKKHEPDVNMLGDIWLCQNTAGSPSDPSQNDRSQGNRPQGNRQADPLQRTDPIITPERNDADAGDNTTNNAANNTAQQNTDSQLPPTNNGGTLIGGNLPAPPVIPAGNNVVEDDDSIEVEQVVIITATMQEAITLTDTMTNEYGARVKTRENMENIGFVLNVFRLTAGQSVNELLPVLRQRFTNLWIDSNQRFTLMAGDRKRYGQNAMQWQPELGGCISNVGIGIIDTDVNLQHPSLNGVAITANNFIDRGETPANTDHGTAVAALIAGNPNTPEFQGLLPKVNIFAAGVFRQRGREKETTTEWLLKAINWLSAQPVDVINLSLGGSRNIVVELALQQVMVQGKIVVAAAGNEGPKSAAVFPAAQEGVVAVTAVDAKQKRYRKANIGQYIDIAAPGVDIWVANQKGKGHYQSGTSYATPMVSAAIAAYVGNQQISFSNLQNKLPTLTDDIGPSGKDNEFGWGLMRWPVECNNTLATNN